jgi:hypothetical protein
MFLIWRAFYALIGSRGFISTVALLIRACDLIKPGAAMNVLDSRIGESWPRRVPGWVNVHLSAALWKLRRHRASARETPRTTTVAAPARRFRVGCFGAFSGLISFPKVLFDAFPPEWDLFVYDIKYKDRTAAYLRELAVRYRVFDTADGRGYDATVKDTADAVNADQLDLLVTFQSKTNAYDLLDRVTTPCIANVCTGSVLLHHPKVDVQIYCQPEADYFPEANTLFCGTTRSIVPGIRVHSGWIFFDPRDLDVGGQITPWAKRDPLIVFHGSLFKIASAPFLDCLFDVMNEVTNTDFVFFGGDGGGALQTISAAAARRGLSGRAHYAGAYSAMRDSSGAVPDQGWKQLVECLAKARLSPNPWPIGGASARFEAYLMGAPTVHLRLRTDPGSWGRPQPTLVDLPWLAAATSSVRTIDGYRRACLRCLTDETFASAVVAEQLEIARRACDGTAYWSQISAAYQSWRAVSS